MSESESNPRPALPDELPQLPDFSQLPLQVLHSGTVETLLGLSDDLLARLRVNLRRNAILEGKLIETERQLDDLEATNGTLQSQLQVRLEKEALQLEKSMRLELAQAQLQNQIERQTAEAKDLRTQTRGLKSLLRYQARVRRWVRPLIDKIERQLQETLDSGYRREAVLSDVRARLSDSEEQLQLVEKNFTRDQARLVEQYENAQKILAADIEKLLTENRALRERTALLDKALKAEATSQNQIIALERRIEELLSQRENSPKETARAAMESVPRNHFESGSA